jgi:hypothetical protein
MFKEAVIYAALSIGILGSWATLETLKGHKEKLKGLSWFTVELVLMFILLFCVFLFIFRSFWWFSQLPI